MLAEENIEFGEVYKECFLDEATLDLRSYSVLIDSYSSVLLLTLSLFDCRKLTSCTIRPVVTNTPPMMPQRRTKNFTKDCLNSVILTQIGSTWYLKKIPFDKER